MLPSRSAVNTTSARAARRRRPCTKRSVRPNRFATSATVARSLCMTCRNAKASSAGFIDRRWKFSARLASSASSAFVIGSTGTSKCSGSSPAAIAAWTWLSRLPPAVIALLAGDRQTDQVLDDAASHDVGTELEIRRFVLDLADIKRRKGKPGCWHQHDLGHGRSPLRAATPHWGRLGHDRVSRPLASTRSAGPLPLSSSVGSGA
jgi:hypothetical protein